jgi:hypothetical protein
LKIERLKIKNKAAEATLGYPELINTGLNTWFSIFNLQFF